MTTPTRRGLMLSGIALLAGAALPRGGRAQDWPAKPVRFIVPFPPGGPVDTMARAMTAKLAEHWNQPALVDNRAGAGGILGADIAAKAPADGYDFFVCSIHHAVLPSLKKSLPYDIQKSFVPVSFGAMFPVILVVHPALPVNTVPELIAYAKANPGTLSYSSAGTGGGTHLSAELFKSMAGIDLLHVPYKGSAPAMNDLLGGVVQMMFADAPTALPQMRAGRVRPLAVASPQPSALAPGLPTIASTVPGYEAYSWAGVVAPAGTPKEIVARLSADIVAALSDPAVKQRLLDAGAEAAPGTPEQFGRQLQAEIDKWAAVVEAAGIQAD